MRCQLYPLLAIFALLQSIIPSVSFQHGHQLPQSRPKESSSFVQTTKSLPSPQRRILHSKTELQASPLAAVASSPVGALSVLAGIVLVHEAGHYLAARSFNITVQEFAIGFGPKVVGFEAIGNEFNVRALPLGGYVRFPENYNISDVEELQKKARNAFMKRREEEEWTWKEDTLNILTFGLWDDRQRKAKMKQKALEQAEVEANRPWWTKAFSRSKGKNPNSSDNDVEDFEIEYYEDPNLLQNRPWPERAVVLSGGVIFNMILAFVLYFGQIEYGGGIPQPTFDAGVVVSQNPRQDGAAAGLLRKNDILLSVNDQPLVLKSNTPKGAQMQVSSVIGTIRETPVGEAVKFTVRRESQNLDVSITPKRTGSTSTIGVLLGPNFLQMDRLQSKDPVQAATLAYNYLVQVISQTADGVFTLLATYLMGQSPPPGQSVSGPIGLIKSGSEVVSTRDLTAVTLFAAALSVNLGVINALPFPALDGGQLVFVLAEAVTGRKVNQRLQEAISSIAVLLLLFLSVSTAFSDVGSIMSGR